MMAWSSESQRLVVWVLQLLTTVISNKQNQPRRPWGGLGRYKETQPSECCCCLSLVESLVKKFRKIENESLSKIWEIREIQGNDSTFLHGFAWSSSGHTRPVELKWTPPAPMELMPSMTLSLTVSRTTVVCDTTAVTNCDNVTVTWDCDTLWLWLSLSGRAPPPSLLQPPLKTDFHCRIPL